MDFNYLENKKGQDELGMVTLACHSKIEPGGSCIVIPGSTARLVLKGIAQGTVVQAFMGRRGKQVSEF